MAPPALARFQRLSLLAILVIGAGLRFAGIGQLSMTHFDEGVYVASGLRVAIEGPFHLYFSQPLQAPPLLPWMIGALYWVTQNLWPGMGVLVAALLGTATILVQFGLARRLGGNGFGLVAAGLLAASDFHVEFSRMALTDVPVTFWFVLAMYCMVRLFDAATAERAHGVERLADRHRSPRRSRAAKALHPKLELAGWMLATGLAVAGAWNTKYNGWLPVAIALTAVVMAAARPAVAARLRPASARTPPAGGVAEVRVAGLPRGSVPRLVGCVLAVGVVAAACYLPWYRYVEATFPGGYGAVNENHRSYFSGPRAWPDHARHLLACLPAFRHYGWALTLVAAVAAAGVQLARQRRARTVERQAEVSLGVVGIALAVAAIAIATAVGTDELLLFLGVAGVLPALVWGRPVELLLAVWVGAFVVLVPLYHPYVRLLVPVMPAAICLAARTVRSALARQRSPQRTWCVAAVAAALLCGAGAAALDNPFGLLPSSGVWRRWSARESYRAFGQATARRLEAPAVVLCQGLPPLWLYSERQPVILEDSSFADALRNIPADTPCYLAVDFWMHEQPRRVALAAVEANLECLEPLAVIPNDLNIVTLLDWRLPAEVAAKLARAWPPRELADRAGREMAFPPSLREPYEDVIVLYRIDRGCDKLVSLQRPQ